MYEQIKEILERYDVYDFEIEDKTITDIIEILEDAIYDYGDETCSYDVTIIENMHNAIKELTQIA